MKKLTSNSIIYGIAKGYSMLDDMIGDYFRKLELTEKCWGGNFLKYFN